MEKMKGQGLIEVLIALAVAVLFISAASLSILSALSNAQHSKNQSLATSYAQQGIEYMKNYAVMPGTNIQSLHFNTTYCWDTIPCPSTPPWNGFFNNGGGANNNCSPVVSGQFCRNTIGTTIFERRVIVKQQGEVGFSCNVSGDLSADQQVDVIVGWSDNKCTSGNDYCNKVDVSTCISDINNVIAP